MFGAMLGLKINFTKSDMMLVLDDDSKGLMYAGMFVCYIGSRPISYPGVPVCRSQTLSLMKNLRKNWMAGLATPFQLVRGLSSSNPICVAYTSISCPCICCPIQIFRLTTDRVLKMYDMVIWQLVCKPKGKGGLGVKISNL